MDYLVRKKTYVSDKIQISQVAQNKKLTIGPSEIFRNNLIIFDDGLPDGAYTPMKEFGRAFRRTFSRKAYCSL